MKVPTQVALFAVPFACDHAPNLALSIFKEQLNQINIPCKLFYLNNEFSKKIGPKAYTSAVLISNIISYRTAWNENCDDVTESSGMSINEKLGFLLLRNEFEKFVDEVIDRDYSQYTIFGFAGILSQIPSVFSFARRLKIKYPLAKFFFGGTSFFKHMGIEYIKKLDFIDCVALHAAEKTFVSIVQDMSSGKSFDKSCEGINGIAYRSENKCLIINDKYDYKLNDIPVPDFSDYYRDVGEPSLWPIYFSRGCSWADCQCCTFCVEKQLSGPYVAKTFEDSLKYLQEYVKKNPNCSNILCCDCLINHTFINKVLLPWSKIRPNNVKMFVEVKPWISKHDVSILKKAGVDKLQTGIENIDDRVCNLLKKGHKTYHSIGFLKYAKHYNIKTMWNYLFPVIGEDGSWCEQQLKICQNIRHFQPPIISLSLVVTQFSDYWSNPDKWGIELIPGQIYPPYIDSRSVSWDFISIEHVPYKHNVYYIELIDFMFEWGGVKQCMPRSIFNKHINTTEYAGEDRTLVFTDDGYIFDSRFNRLGNKIRISDIERDILIFCEQPKKIIELVKTFGQKTIDKLENKRLLYCGSGHCISYVECLE